MKQILLVVVVLISLLPLVVFGKAGGHKHASKKVPLMSIAHVTEEDQIENEYIVVFHKSLSSTQRRQHLETFQQLHRPESQQKRSTGSSSSLRLRNTFEVIHTSKINDFHSYTAKISPDVLNKLRKQSDHIDYIEPNIVMKTSEIQEEMEPVQQGQECAKQEDVPWNLHRISAQGPLSEIDPDFIYPSTAGAGVTVYVVDTGVNVNHNQFEGRAKWGGNFVDTENRDCQGHGTHVAGTVASARYGVAKKAKIIAVKVLGCDGRGSVSSVIKGLEFAVNDAAKPAVINLSLGGAYSASLNTAVNNVVAQGFLVVVAAGNEDRDSCGGSPSSAADAFSVGATTQSADDAGSQDERSWFSNYGPCVHIFAPGTLIKSTWSSSNTASNTISGTSMAAPHVAGAAALYLAMNPIATPTEIKNYILNRASGALIQLDCTNAVCRQSPNKLLYTGCSSS